MWVGSPRQVVVARTEEEVAEAVRYAARVRREVGHVPFSVRSGGHGIAGHSTNDGGIVLDVSALREVRLLDEPSNRFRAQPGASWGDVAQPLARRDLAITSGNFGGTGVGGLAVSGGVGYFVRSQGLTIDHVRAVRLVTADGAVHEVDAERDPELFWAVRGGGAQLGVATAFVFDAETMGSADGNAGVIRQTVHHRVTDLPSFMRRWGCFLAVAPRALTSFLRIHAAGADGFVVAATNVWAGSDPDIAIPQLEAYLDLEEVIGQEAVLASYAGIVPHTRSEHVGQQRIQLRSGLVDRADESLGAALEAVLANPVAALAEVRSLGGAESDVPVDATAWAHRHQQALVAAWVHPAGDAAIDAAWAPLEALSTGVYAAYTSDTRPELAAKAWPGETGERLRAVAERVDPDGLFDAGLILRG